MKIPLNDIILIYENIVREINIAEVSMIIFTALDIDSLCTLRILSNFLKNQHIEFKIYPVISFSDLEDRIEDCKAFQKIRLFFFINCGGMLDLSTKWLTKQAQVILFDSNRPIHHGNIQSPNINIVDDNFGQFQKAPTTQQFQVYENIDDDQIQQLAEKQQVQQEDSDEDDMIARRRKRNKSSQEQKLRYQKIRKIKLQVNEKVQEYYSKQFFGLPSSFIAYKMIKQLNKSQNNYLWAAIIGITAMYFQYKLQKQQFEQLSQFCKIDLSRLNSVARQGQNTNNLVYKNSLKRKLDFQFPLLRHWSLYESIMNSPYMITYLGLWDQNGIKKLHQLLSSIGLSLQQSRQLYKYMLKSSIDKFQDKIFTFAGVQKFKLLDVAFQSFAKQVDYAFQMTASDYYYAISAVLERPLKNTEILTNEHRIQCFWEAYNLFSANQTKLLAAVQQSKHILQIFTKQSKNILQRNHIMNGNFFGFVNIYNDTEDRKLFQHPNVLSKFAYILMIMNKQKKKKDKPFIASISNNVTKTAQIVGIMSDPKNQFSSKFNSVITKLGIDVNYQCFMNNIITISKDSLVKLVKQLGNM